MTCTKTKLLQVICLTILFTWPKKEIHTEIKNSAYIQQLLCEEVCEKFLNT